MAVANVSQFQELIAGSQSVLVLLPKNPSFDTVAAGLSLYVALQNYGKKANIACPTQMIVDFNRLVGVDKVETGLAGKNLIIEFDKNASRAVERVRYEGEQDNLKLVVIPVGEAAPPRADQIKFSYSGASADLVIVVGATKKGDYGKFSQDAELFAGKLVLLANSPIHEFGSCLELLDAEAQSLSQIATEVIKQCNLPIDADVATNLFMGLERASNGFSEKWVSASTFSTAAHLMEAGARRNQQGPLGQKTKAGQEPGAGDLDKSPAPAEWIEPGHLKGSTLP